MNPNVKFIHTLNNGGVNNSRITTSPNNNRLYYIPYTLPKAIIIAPGNRLYVRKDIEDSIYYIEVLPKNYIVDSSFNVVGWNYRKVNDSKSTYGLESEHNIKSLPAKVLNITRDVYTKLGYEIRRKDVQEEDDSYYKYESNRMVEEIRRNDSKKTGFDFYNTYNFADLSKWVKDEIIGNIPDDIILYNDKLLITKGYSYIDDDGNPSTGEFSLIGYGYIRHARWVTSLRIYDTISSKAVMGCYLHVERSTCDEILVRDSNLGVLYRLPWYEEMIWNTMRPFFGFTGDPEKDKQIVIRLGDDYYAGRVKVNRDEYIIHKDIHFYRDDKAFSSSAMDDLLKDLMKTHVNTGGDFFITDVLTNKVK